MWTAEETKINWHGGRKVICAPQIDTFDLFMHFYSTGIIIKLELEWFIKCFKFFSPLGELDNLRKSVTQGKDFFFLIHTNAVTFQIELAFYTYRWIMSNAIEWTFHWQTIFFFHHLSFLKVWFDFLCCTKQFDLTHFRFHRFFLWFDILWSNFIQLSEKK